MPRLPEKAVDLLATTGFAAAGVVSVVAQNLRTLADRDEALTDRAKQVAQNSLGAVLGGPSALTDRGRQLVGRDGGSGNGRSAGAPQGPTADRGDRRPDGRTEATKTTAKTVAPDERPDRSKAEEARDRQADDDERVTATGKAAEKTAEKAATKKTATEKTATKKTATEKDSKQKGSTEKKGSTAKKAATKKTAKKSSTAKATSGTADPDRSVEEQRAAQKAAKKQQGAKKQGDGQADAKPEGLPSDVDEQLVADLQRMTVKQLRDRAAQDGVPGRADMSKDELVVALATRETDDVPAKA